MKAPLRLGNRQMLVLLDLASQGVWRENREIGGLTVARARAAAQTLDDRGLAGHRGRDWFITLAGYAWLIRDAGSDLAMLEFGSKAADKVLDRIRHLATLARLVEAWGHPVDWKGQRTTCG